MENVQLKGKLLAVKQSSSTLVLNGKPNLRKLAPTTVSPSSPVLPFVLSMRAWIRRGRPGRANTWDLTDGQPVIIICIGWRGNAHNANYRSSG